MIKKEKECRHSWSNILTQRGSQVFSVKMARLCLKCGILKVGLHTIKISKNRLDMGNLPINNALKVLVNNTGGRLKIPVGTNLYD